MTKDSFELGIKVAAARYGLQSQDVLAKKTAYSILDNSIEMQKLYSQTGVQILKQAGEQNSLECKILEKCANYDTLLTKEAYDRFISPVEKALQKKAFVDSAGTVLGMASDVASTLFLTSLAVGAAGGAGVWGIRRASNQEDAKTLAKFKQGQKYKQLAQDIKDELRAKNKDLGLNTRNNANQVVNKPLDQQVYQF